MGDTPNGQLSTPDRDAERLPCGAAVDEVLEQVAHGSGQQRDEHQQDCPHCQASLTELGRLWAPVRDYSRQPLPAPPAILEGVMRGVRRLAQNTWYTLDLRDGGTLRVAARVVAVLARDAARRVPGVRAALGRSTTSRLALLAERSTLRHQHPHSAVGVLGKTAVIDMAIAIAYGPPASDVAAQVQQAVIAKLQDGIGLQSVIVNVTVDDIDAPVSP